ncbi:hypothetical protein ACFXPI_11225 [Streptomyces sp. NPDC059104]|uniref:hypothetical protein n=1 Tax=Streptomyces sp. NPDC059104 TaxID=3346729 RepID=UPI00367B96A5
MKPDSPTAPRRALPGTGPRVPPALPAGTGRPGRPARQAWPDAAKGMCILLVALQHEAMAVLSRRIPKVLSSTVLAACYPLLATAAITAASLLIHAVLLRARARWLFELPGTAAGPTR